MNYKEKEKLQLELLEFVKPYDIECYELLKQKKIKYNKYKYLLFYCSVIIASMIICGIGPTLSDIYFSIDVFLPFSIGSVVVKLFLVLGIIAGLGTLFIILLIIIADYIEGRKVSRLFALESVERSYVNSTLQKLRFDEETRKVFYANNIGVVLETTNGYVSLSRFNDLYPSNERNKGDEIISYYYYSLNDNNFIEIKFKFYKKEDLKDKQIV